MQQDGQFQLSSPAFADGDVIPQRFTCKGENISPPLAVRNVPEGTASLALIMHDLDSPRGDFLHWTMWNLNADVRVLSERQVPDAAMQGMNDFGEIGYGGPCPNAGTHRYVFDLYALDAQLDLANGASRAELMEAIEDHVIAQTGLRGTFGA